jgi:GAF domain-containing protein
VLSQLWCQLIHDLRDLAEGQAPLAGPSYDEQSMLARCHEHGDNNLVFHHHMTKMLLRMWLGDLPSARAAAHACRPYYAQGAFGIFLGPVFVFWEGLLWAWSARSEPRERRPALRKLASACRQLARWAQNAPMNFAHKEHLLRAELCRARGKSDRAAWHYEQAIELAHAHGYTHETAAAQERAAEFYFERGMQRLGRACLHDSHQSYLRWGAKGVARRLERTYPEHFALFASRPLTLEPGAMQGGQDLDHHVLLLASQAISGEVQLPKLLERLLYTMFEHAGAQRALLVLEQQGQLWVEAEADIDRGGVQLIRGEPLEESARLCRGVVRYVARTQQPLVLEDASRDERFRADPYVRARRPRSLLCTPLIHQSRLLGVAYLENNRVSHVFTQARLEVANLLAAQAAISLASARMHALELEAQQAKINPHFLFNALSSLAELAVVDGARTEQAIVQLAHLYRYVLASSLEERVSLDSELEVVRSYLALEQLRFGAKLAYEISCDEAVRAVEIPGLLIQPLVENAIRHGIAAKLGAGHVWVHASQIDDQCRIVVQDDGDGTPSTPGTGFGLRSVQERCALLYGNAYSMAISRRSGGYRVELALPLVRPPLERPIEFQSTRPVSRGGPVV